MIEETLKRRNIYKVIICGHSLGTNFSIYLIYKKRYLIKGYINLCGLSNYWIIGYINMYVLSII